MTIRKERRDRKETGLMKAGAGLSIGESGKKWHEARRGAERVVSWTRRVPSLSIRAACFHLS